MKNISTLYSFNVPEKKKIRLIINTDAKNEADDQYAIVHAMLTPKFVIKGIIGAHFGEEKSSRSMNDSYDEIVKIMDLMETETSIPVLHGAPHALKDENLTVESEGSGLIIREALRDDPLPLFCIFLGPLTDMASALIEEPKIAPRLTAVWIGGGAWPDGGEEYNLHNDIRAANVVFGSDAALWQIPRNVYSMMKVGLAELQVKVKPCAAIGRYLFTQTVEFNDKYADNRGWPLGESWVLGDSPAVGVLLDDHAHCYAMERSPRIDDRMNYMHEMRNRKMRVYRSIDPRFILEDFFCKLAVFAGNA